MINFLNLAFIDTKLINGVFELTGMVISNAVKLNQNGRGNNSKHLPKELD